MSKYCPDCGTLLHPQYLESEGKDIDYCDTCQKYVFPTFNSAVSMIVLDEKKENILLIQQYNKHANILVAGYINKGEDAEEACKRELKEEVGLTPISISFNHSHYFKPSNTLMLNFTVIVKDTKVTPNEEIDSYEWFPIEKAKEAIKPNSLAQDFLLGFLENNWHFSI